MYLRSNVFVAQYLALFWARTKVHPKSHTYALFCSINSVSNVFMLASHYVCVWRHLPSTGKRFILPVSNENVSVFRL